MPRGRTPAGRPPIHVVVLDVRRLVREGVRMLLAEDPRLAVTAAESVDAVEAERAVDQSPVYVVGRGTPDVRGARCVPLEDTVEMADLADRLVAAADELVDVRTDPGPAVTSGATLTPRERAVLRGVSGGHSAVEIGSDLGISPRTVEWHKQSLTAKLGATSPARAVVLGHELGLLQDAG